MRSSPEFNVSVRPKNTNDQTMIASDDKQKLADRAKQYAPKQVSEWKYKAQLWRARLTADGKMLVASGYDATVQRWQVDQEKPRQLPSLTGHNGWVQGVAVHPQLPLLYSADSWGRLCCWNLADETKGAKPAWQHPSAHQGWIRDLAVSNDGTMLATCGDGGEVRLWSSHDGKMLRALEGHPVNVMSIAFHPQQATVLTGDLQGSIRAMDCKSGKQVKTFDAGWLYQHHRIQHCGGVRCLSFDASGDRLLCGGQQTPVGGFANGTPGAMLFDWKSAKKKQELTVGAAGDGFMYDVQFHPDGFMMGVSCAFPGKGHLWFWQPDEQKPFVMDKKFNNGRSLALYPDGKRMAMLVSDSPNRNGRLLKDGQYEGGSARIRLLQLGETV